MSKNYKDYLESPHWRRLHEQHISSNRNARCWICKRTNTLLLHHIRYDNLDNEELGRDLYILCFSCHERVHFRKRDGRKTPLERTILLRRMRFLKYTFGVRNFRLGTLVNTMVDYLIHTYRI